LRFVSHIVINNILNDAKLSQKWKTTIITPIYKVMNKVSVVIMEEIPLLSTYKIVSATVFLTSYVEEITGDHLYGLRRTSQLLIRYWRTNGNKMGQ
jgi:hypothetical protein